MFPTDAISSFHQLILTFACCFSRPTAQSFATVAWGWVSCLGRRTLTHVVSCAGQRAGKHVASYNRFFSKASWSLEEVWRVLLVQILLPILSSTGLVEIAVDDTTAQRWGRSIAYAGWFRDAARSTRTHDVVHWAHNWIVACLLIRLPFWPTRVLSLPICAVLFRREDDCKDGVVFKTRLELALEMIRKVREWIPEREIRVVADGAYASREIIRLLPERVHFVARLRRDAALNELPPAKRPKGYKGRPRLKGLRLGTLADMAKNAAFRSVFIVQYGRKRKRLVHSFVALWYHVAKGTPLRIVIVRDPQGKQRDDFFFTTDVKMSPTEVATLYAARWGIEECFREAKQLMGFESVHGWTAKTVERQAPFALLMLSLVKVAHVRLRTNQRTETLPPLHSMLLDLRLAEWRHHISCLSLSKEDMRLIEERLAAALASAA